MKIKLRPVERFVVSWENEKEIVFGKYHGDYIEVMNLKNVLNFLESWDMSNSIPVVYKLIRWNPKDKKEKA